MKKMLMEKVPLLHRECLEFFELMEKVLHHLLDICECENVRKLNVLLAFLVAVIGCNELNLFV